MRLVLVVVVLCLTATACAAPDASLCDRAASAHGQRQLAQAQVLYAHAEQHGEGSCGSEGVARLADELGQVSVELAHARAFEAAGALTAAGNRYEAALELDAGNQVAIAGVRRVERTPPADAEVWTVARRLHQEGFDDAARKEMIRVLRAHPKEHVPQDLLPLTVKSPSAELPLEPEFPITFGWAIEIASWLAVFLLAPLFWWAAHMRDQPSNVPAAPSDASGAGLSRFWSWLKSRLQRPDSPTVGS